MANILRKSLEHICDLYVPCMDSSGARPPQRPVDSRVGFLEAWGSALA